MNKKLLLAAFALPFAAAVGAQTSLGHLDQTELNILLQEGPRKAPALGETENITLLVRVASNSVVSRLEAAGAKVLQQEGRIVIIELPPARVEEALKCQGVVSASLSKPQRLLDGADETEAWTSPYGEDLSRQMLGLDRVHSAAEPFAQPYTGEGVVVGIVDQGIDAHHPNFRDDNGDYRIKRIWKHVVQGKATATLTSDTPEKIAKFVTDYTAYTHGTHVMGIAAGSFADTATPGAPDFRGAAPGADIAVSCGAQTNANILKGVRAITDYAASEGKPCVINISLGNNKGPHDGSDELTSALDAIAQETGATFCIAAGNEGAYKNFLVKELSDDDEESSALRSFFLPNNYTAAVWPSMAMFPQAIGSFQVWGEDSTQLRVYLDVIDLRNPSPALTSIELPNGQPAYISNASDNIGVLSRYIDRNNEAFNQWFFNSYIGGEGALDAASGRYYVEGKVRLELMDEDAFRSHVVALRVEGPAGKKVYVYGLAGSQGVYGYEFGSLNGPGYSESDGNGSINSLACGHNTIAVGACTSHNFDEDHFNQQTVGGTLSYSSWGVTLDGRHLPHVCAPGNLIVSSMSADYVNGQYFNPESDIIYYTYDDPDGNKSYWTPMTGTSMATPFMTGVAALWLQADPTLTTADIIQIAQQTATEPVEATPQAGASGNLDAYAGLCKVLGLSGLGDVRTDLPADFDPSAPVEWFDLQGRPVANPANGLYIRRQGTNVQKIAL